MTAFLIDRRLAEVSRNQAIFYIVSEKWRGKTRRRRVESNLVVVIIRTFFWLVFGIAGRA